jgi:hypothetical protein
MWTEVAGVPPPTPKMVSIVNTAVSSFTIGTRADYLCPGSTPTCHNRTFAPICFVLPSGLQYSVGTYKCAYVDARKPYCNGTEYSHTPSPTCAAPVTQTGYDEGCFVDTDDCQSSSFLTSTEIIQFTPAPVTICTLTWTRNKACECSKAITDCSVIKCTNAMSEYVV